MHPRTILLSSAQLLQPVMATTLWLLALISPLAADTFVLKDGSKVDGVILRQDATTYTLEVKIGKSIKDERVVAKANVVQVVRPAPSLAAFAAVRQLLPTPDLLTAADYAHRIHTVEKFVRDYPTSGQLQEAQACLSALKAEAKEVLAGGVKLNGKIVPSAERAANRYAVDAQVQKLKILKWSSEGNALQALRAFAAMEQNFRNVTAYTELVPRILPLITAYLSEAGQSLATLEARVHARKLGLERMPAMDRRDTENAIRQENSALEAQFKKESTAKIGWVTTHPYFKPSLDATVAFAKSELVRLAAIKNPPEVDGGKAYRDAWTLIQAHGDPSQVAAALAAAKAALVPERYLAILEATAAGKADP